MTKAPTRTEPRAADCLEGAPHPRTSAQLFGQERAQAAFLGALASGRLHHNWLLCGPRGIGKATFAWQIARFLLANGKEAPARALAAASAHGFHALDVAPDHPVARRIHAGVEPRLFAMRRTWDEKAGRLKSRITVDDVRALGGFLTLSAVGGGHRAVIVDSADEMNPNAANALLKLLEEPPAHTTLLLIAHQPGQLLPTIRSRCQMLRLAPLGAEDLHRALLQAGRGETDIQGAGAALAELAAGSVGAAIRLTHHNGIETYTRLLSVLGEFPKMTHARALDLAEAHAAKNSEDRFDLFMTLLDRMLARLACTGARGRGPDVPIATEETRILTRLAPTLDHGRRWAQGAQEIQSTMRHGQWVHLDPAALVLDALFKMQRIARAP